ncbi:hypothetical protein LUW76_00520 [Actinomadura madurae]|uniref:hypothetical protein n=1 Tax=Actinomadura madurae TaxID=1993 RepID=UPI0020266DEC|nr:hypothetical protein [Actinomadura madurae]URM92948.1 hypothetical protein LUW76_00520 [Actinomadura madurae]
MPDQSKIHEGKIVPPPKGGRPPAMEAFAALNQVVEAVRDCIRTHEEQATVRSRIAACEATEVARIKAGEAVLKDYFSQVFAERRSLYDELSSRLDAERARRDRRRPGVGLRSHADPLNCQGNGRRTDRARDDAWGLPNRATVQLWTSVTVSRRSTTSHPAGACR